MEKFIQEYQGTGGHAFCTFYKTLQVKLLVAENRHQEAVALVDDTLNEGHQMSEQWWASELHRLKGLALVNHDACQLVPATGIILKGADIAAKQGATMLELRALCSLANIGALDNNAQHLARLRATFEACDDDQEWPDITEARKVLDRLSK